MDGLPDKRLIGGLMEEILREGRVGRPQCAPVSTTQATLKQSISCVGIGLHTGLRVTLTLSPAAPGTGIVFHRSDLGVDIPATFDRVMDTRLCTVIGQGAERVATVEHLMAALIGSGIDNAIVAVDGPEVPVLDGSAEGFVFLLDCAGRVEQTAPRKVIEVLRPVRVEEGPAFAELRPNLRDTLEIALSIDFAAPAIGRQAFSLDISPDSFRQELMRARTFTQASEVAELQRSGLARGGSLANAIVVNGDKIENPEGLRMPDEFVRHKMLDIVGDLALAGAAIHGRVVAHRTGHTLNNRLLRSLLEDSSAWRLISLDSTEDWRSAA